MAGKRIAASLILCLTGFVIALVLLSTHYGVPLLGEAVLASCGAGGGCDIVSQSRYSSLFGVPLAAIGLTFYGSLFALLAPVLFGKADDGDEAAPSLAFQLVALAVAIDFGLLGLQAFAIKAFCKYCIATYFVNLSLLALLWPARQFARLRGLGSREGKRSLAAWVAATVAMVLASLAFDAALKDRKALAGSSILGVPLGLQAPISKGSIEEQLAQAQAEAKKWKDTLDDEKRLQIYLNEKAKTDFNETEVVKLDLSRAPLQGAKDAPIEVVSFSDFMCPFCRDLAVALRNFLPRSANRVKSYYKHFPLDLACNSGIGRTVHPGACELALAGICADDRGRFVEFHDKVFSRSWDRATRADALDIGASVGLDRAQLDVCMASAATKGRLAKDIEEGDRVRVDSTPTMFVNGRKLKSPGVFLLAIEEERKRLKLPALSAVTPQP